VESISPTWTTFVVTLPSGLPL